MFSYWNSVKNRIINILKYHVNSSTQIFFSALCIQNVEQNDEMKKKWGRKYDEVSSGICTLICEGKKCVCV